MNIELVISRMASIAVIPDLIDGLAESQAVDSDFVKLFEKAKSQKCSEFNVKEDGILCLGNRLFVPNRSELKQLILNEAHNSH